MRDSILKGVVGFLSGWLFAIYLVVPFSSVHTEEGWKYVANHCMKVAENQREYLNHLIGIKPSRVPLKKITKNEKGKKSGVGGERWKKK